MAIGTPTQSWDGTSWSFDSPLFTPTSVSCPSGALSCMAAGPAGFESFDGSSWTQIASSVATPTDVSCPEADFCMAVGASTSVETWDGTSWSTVSPPAPPAGSTDFGLSAASCAAATSCEVGGEYTQDVTFTPCPTPPHEPTCTIPIGFPYLADWNGTSWSEVSISEPIPTFASVSAISCPAPGDCLELIGPTLYVEGAEIAQPSGLGDGSIDTISCPDTSTCVAAGSTGNGGVPVIETYSDSTWSIDSTPSLPLNDGSLSGVSCASESFCVAVGDTGGQWPLIESNSLMPAPVLPTVTVTPWTNPTVTGTVNVTVAVSGTSGTPTGEVNIAGEPGCTATLTSGQASCTITLNAPFGSDMVAVSAVYDGDSVYSPAEGYVEETVNPATPDLEVAPVDDPAPSGPVAYDVTVSGAGAAPQGTVSLNDGVGGTCAANLGTEVGSTSTGSCDIIEAASANPYTVTATFADAVDVDDYTTATAVTTETVLDSPSITSPDTANAVAGTSFTFSVTTFSPQATPIIKASGLPKGLALTNNGNGTAAISGAPSTKDAGLYTATITATVKAHPPATQSLQVTVDNPGVFSSKAKDLVRTGTAFSYPITTRYAYPTPSISTASTLPGGVTLTDNENGTAILGGTPDADAGGIYPITISSANGAGSPVGQTYTLTVYQAPVVTSVTSDTVTAGVAMVPFTVSATGYPTPVVKAAGLPYGVHLVDNHNGTGTISGTPRGTAAGAYNVSIMATSKAGSISQAFTLTVNP